jgi:hypothetical protein
MQEEVVTADSAKKDNMEGEMKMEGMDLFSEYNYDYLRSPVNYSADAPVKEILLNLENMQRYIWSMNGVSS